MSARARIEGSVCRRLLQECCALGAQRTASLHVVLGATSQGLNSDAVNKFTFMR